MNNFDLESQLKSVRVPERPEDYWNDFPSRVRVQLPRERREFAPPGAWRPRLAWAGGFALAVALVFCLRPVSSAPSRVARHHETTAAFSRAPRAAGRRAACADAEHGMAWVIC